MGDFVGHPFRGNQWTQGTGFPADDVVREGGGAYDDVAVRRMMKNQPPLDDETSSAVYDYIARGDYQPMNEYMRKHPKRFARMTPDTQGVSEAVHNATLIQEALNEPLDDPVLVYRATSLGPEATAKLGQPGSTLKLAGFQSASLDPAVATGFSGEHILEIKATRGRLLEDSAEKELLMPHGSKFRVVGTKTVKMRVNPGRMYEPSRQPIREVKVIQLEQVG